MVEKKTQMDLFQTVSSMSSEYSASQEKVKDIYEKMKEELAKSESLIKQRYQEKINLAENSTKSLESELGHYTKLLESYSTFEAEMIGEIIEKLVTLIEGEDYSYQKAIHETYDRIPTVYGGECFKAIKRILMIAKGTQNQKSYFDNNEQEDEVYKLVKNGHGFVLAKNPNAYNKTIAFYVSTGKGVKCLIDFNKFSYVKDFIDLVIQYRFENHLDEISEKELLSLMSGFILSSKEIIEDNYRKRALEKQKYLEQEAINEQKRLEEAIEQMELENLLQNGVPKRHNNNLIDRLQEIASNSAKFSEAMNSFEISYEGENQTAKITGGDALVSTENIFISRINFNSFIKDYFDCSDFDPHFHGFCDINLVDDGLVGIVDISNLSSASEDIVHSLSQYGYRFDKIDDKYLRVLYLPNKAEYRHKSLNVYGWIAGSLFDRTHESMGGNVTSYRTDWNTSEEAERMLTCLKEIEVLSNLNDKQLKLYKQRENKN